MIALALFAPETLPADPVDRTGFDIGWDHAHHGLVPPPGLLLDGTPVSQGWRAAKAVFGPRTLAASRWWRLALQLRTQAWRQGIAFETLQVTPQYLSQLHGERCPVLRQPLGGAAGAPLAAVVERINPLAGYAAGNLVVLSQRAAQARAGLSLADLQRRARVATLADQPVDGLDAAAWWRLAALQAMATPLPFAQSASVPLALLPPNRVRLLNAAQGLQALVTLQFLSPGWSARARALADLLPAPALRQDFNLFIGAMAPRVIEAGPEPRALRHALEDAWLHERVQRRWQHLLLSLGEAACETLLQRAAAAGLAGVRLLCHTADAATEGWSLADHGRVPMGEVPAAARGALQSTAGRRTPPRPPKNSSTTMVARLA